MGLIDRLIERAKRTPYFHLDGYMNRWWLVPYNKVISREARELVEEHPTHCVYQSYSTDDGTGPVTWRRPVARLLQKCGIAVRIHQILRSDCGRDPHDHPWWYLTVILRGGYYERRFSEEGYSVSTKWHGPGGILFRRANSWHRLIVPEGESCWTLFITGPKVRTPPE